MRSGGYGKLGAGGDVTTKLRRGRSRTKKLHRGHRGTEDTEFFILDLFGGRIIDREKRGGGEQECVSGGGGGQGRRLGC